MIGLAGAAGLVVLVAAAVSLARDTLTQRWAALGVSLAAVGIGGGLAFVAADRTMLAAGGFLAALALRARREVPARWLAGALSPLVAFLSPGVGVATVVTSGWRAPSRWLPPLEALLATVVMATTRSTPLATAVLLPLTGAGLGWLVAHHTRAIGGAPPRSSTLSMLRLGAVLGVLALLAVDARRPLVGPDAVLRAFLLAGGAALVGALAMLVPVGALVLASVRDEARRVMFLSALAAILAGLVTAGGFAVALLPGVALAGGVGAVRAWHLLPHKSPRSGVDASPQP